MEVPPMNTAVTDPGETVIAAHLARHKVGAARGTAAHKRLSRNAAVYKRLSVNATIHKRAAATGHSSHGQAGTSAATSAEAVSPAVSAATASAVSAAVSAATTSATTTATASAMTTTAAGMRGHRADGNRRRRNRCH